MILVNAFILSMIKSHKLHFLAIKKSSVLQSWGWPCKRLSECFKYELWLLVIQYQSTK